MTLLNQKIEPKFPQRILVVRRDNVGDLVCTTPLIKALRSKFPDAHLAVLVNAYNAPVLEHNPDVDAVYVYQKAKHRSAHEWALKIYLNTWKLIRKLRQQQFDYVILANCGAVSRHVRLIKQLKPKQIIGFVTEKNPLPAINRPVFYGSANTLHEVEDTGRLVASFGIHAPWPPLSVYPDKTLQKYWVEHWQSCTGDPFAKRVAIHISAREPDRRWPAEKFVTLIQRLKEQYSIQPVLSWSPGDESNPMHPGDDKKAKIVIDELDDGSLLALPAQTLPELIAGLSLCDIVICIDGGALHIAAGLNKPILGLFENRQEKITRWYPWQVPHELVIAPVRAVSDIDVASVCEGFRKLWEKLMS